LTSDIVFRKIHEDKRGEIAQIQFHDTTYELFEIVKGALRGGHSHTVDATFIVLYGKVQYREILLEESKEKRMDLQRGDIHLIRAGTPHLVLGLEDSLAVEYRHGGKYESINYPPYRKLVEAYLAS
jgi:quercetin dioxygenase-like cupin family protein